MTLRTPAALLLASTLASAVTAPQGQEQEPDPSRLFVRAQSNLREQPSTASTSLAVLRPSTLATRLDALAPTAGFVRIRTEDGREGWVLATNVRPLLSLEAEERLEPFGGLDSVLATPGAASHRSSASGPCKPFASCPAFGCATQTSHRLTNERKRTIPQSSAKAKLLTFADLDKLQELTDARAIPQGEHLSASMRKKLMNFSVNSKTISEGDLVAATGFVAQDRDVKCGGAESVNCGHKNSSGEADTGPCTRTDIHVPIVESPNGIQIQSFVAEPIPQGPNVKIWVPPAFDKLKDDKRRILVRGGLFYDSIHIVNTSKSPGGQPKRFTLWEIHPIIAVLVCTLADNSCDPTNPNQWVALK